MPETVKREANGVEEDRVNGGSNLGGAGHTHMDELFSPRSQTAEFPLVPKLCLGTHAGPKLCFAGGGVCG